MTRSELCSCGGVITADPRSVALVVAAVQDHNRSPEHLAWRAMREAAEPRVIPVHLDERIPTGFRRVWEEAA